MHHAACKAEFQPINGSYSQLTLFNFSWKNIPNLWYVSWGTVFYTGTRYLFQICCNNLIEVRQLWDVKCVDRHCWGHSAKNGISEGSPAVVPVPALYTAASVCARKKPGTTAATGITHPTLLCGTPTVQNIDYRTWMPETCLKPFLIL